MNRDNRLRAAVNQRFDLGGIEIEGPRLNIDEDRCCSQETHNIGGSNKRKGGNNDLVSGADTAGAQTENQSIGSGSNSHRILPAAVLSNLLLQRFDLGAKNEMLPFEYCIEDRLNLFFNGRVLRLQIENRYRHLHWG